MLQPGISYYAWTLKNYNFLDNSAESIAEWNVQVISENVLLTFILINYFSSTFDFADTSQCHCVIEITEKAHRSDNCLYIFQLDVKMI